MEYSSGQAPLPLADEQAHARIFERDGRDRCPGPIGAVVIHNQNLVGNIQGIEHGTHITEQAADVLGFAERGYHQRKLFRGAPGVLHSRQRQVCRWVNLRGGRLYGC